MTEKISKKSEYIRMLQAFSSDFNLAVNHGFPKCPWLKIQIDQSDARAKKLLEDIELFDKFMLELRVGNIHLICCDDCKWMQRGCSENYCSRGFACDPICYQGELFESKEKR